jgi:hypothetical protein
MLPTLAEMDSAAALIYRHVPPNPQYHWPLREALADTLHLGGRKVILDPPTGTWYRRKVARTHGVSRRQALKFAVHLGQFHRKVFSGIEDWILCGPSPSRLRHPPPRESIGIQWGWAMRAGTAKRNRAHPFV